jgi:hypothetical protein
MPTKKHLRGVNSKEQRQYEHIKEIWHTRSMDSTIFSWKGDCNDSDHRSRWKCRS